MACFVNETQNNIVDLNNRNTCKVIFNTCTFRESMGKFNQQNF